MLINKYGMKILNSLNKTVKYNDIMSWKNENQ